MLADLIDYDLEARDQYCAVVRARCKDRAFIKVDIEGNTDNPGSKVYMRG